MENKKSKVGLIIFIIILILLILFAVWFFLLRDKKDDTKESGNNTEEKGEINTDNPINNATSEFNYTEGILHEIGYLGEEIPFTIDGIILIGNRHNYDGREAGEGAIDYFVSKGYNKDNLNSSFYLNEWIEFYIDTKYYGAPDDVKILAVPHKPVEQYLEMSSTELEEYASENGFVMEYMMPEEDNYKYVGSNYISMDYPEGKYTILFSYRGKLVYYICIDLTKESIE